MATKTEIFGFVKPDINDHYDIKIQNENWNKIDKLVVSRINIVDESHLDEKLLSLFKTMKNESAMFYQFNSSSPSFFSGGAVLAILSKGMTLSDTEFYGTVELIKYSGAGIEKCFKQVVNGEISPLEYMNPPMNVDVEYRTTERWEDKPVYTKLIYCGMMSDGDSIDKPSDASTIVRYEMYCFTKAWMKLPIGNPGFTNYYAYSYTSIDGDSISLKADTNSDGFGHGTYTYRLQIWYTKD